MAVNKQPVFTASPVLVVTRIASADLGTFDPINAAESNSISIFTAGASEGTLIERITIQPMINVDNPVLTEKLLYIIVYDSGNTKSSILAVKKWDAFDMSSTFTEPPKWELTFTGGIILKNGDELYFNQMRSNGGTATSSGDGVFVTVEGSIYTAP